eukprot:Gb_29453 [translate_table: standard]
MEELKKSSVAVFEARKNKKWAVIRNGRAWIRDSPYRMDSTVATLQLTSSFPQLPLVDHAYLSFTVSTPIVTIDTSPNFHFQSRITINFDHIYDQAYKASIKASS